MKNEQIANLLAQIGTDQLEENQVVNILRELYDAMPCSDPENRDYDRLFAATRISKANKSVLESLKSIVCKLMEKRTKGYEPVTANLGTRMFKFYYIPTYHWERVHLPELTDEQRTTMTDEEIEAYEKKHHKLLDWQQLFEEVNQLEKELAPKKLELRGKSEALAVLMPTSKSIRRSPVLQVV